MRAKKAVAATGAPGSPDEGAAPDAGRLVRIQEAADQVGLTARAIRYYEEMGLLQPSARSEGAYRLYDASDLDRLRFIKGLRDDAGFSLGDIRLLLEDQEARRRARDAFRATHDARVRREIVLDRIARVENQAGTLRAKRARLDAMIEDAEGRLDRLRARLAELDAGSAPEPPGGSA